MKVRGLYKMGQYSYNTLNEYYREIFGSKIGKIPLDGGFTCPNRDGTIGTGGCIFCSSHGSGDFVQGSKYSITSQIEEGKEMLNKKWNNIKYIAYFQAYTNTYAPVKELELKYNEALSAEDIVGISIATRPDCLEPDILDLLENLNKKTKLWVELGLQTSKEESSDFIQRGYKNQVFIDGVKELHKRNISVVAHVIIGLPNESNEDILNTIKFVNDLNIQGIKLQLMHVIKDTKLGELYLDGLYSPLTMEEYLNILARCIQELKEDIIVHRFTGDGKKETLLAPLWSLKKGDILNKFHQKLKYENIYQGQLYKK